MTEDEESKVPGPTADGPGRRVGGHEQRPWNADDAFPLKPEGLEYGYKRGSRLIPCSEEELARQFCSWSLFRPRLVWTPESPRLITPAESLLLWPAVRASSLRRIKAVIILCLLMTGLFALMAFSTQPRVRAFRPYGLAHLFLTGLIPLVWAVHRQRAMSIAVPGDTTHVGSLSRFGVWISSCRPTMTWVILGCLAVGGLTQVALGDSRSLGAAAFDRPMVQVGEYWRLVTGSFLHFGWGHFITNFLWITFLACLLENLAGRQHLAIVTLASCVAGGLGSLIFYTEGSSAGASDIFCGLFGFLLVQALLRRPFFPVGMWKLLLWLLALSIVGELWMRNQVNHAAHAGGLLAGLVLGAVLPVPGGRNLRIWGWTSRGLIVATTLGVVVLTAAGRPGISELHNEAWEACEAGDYRSAIETYSKALDINSRYVPAYFGRASARWSLNDLEGARSDYDAVLALEPDNEEALMWRGSARAEMGDLDGGLEDLNRTLSINGMTNRAHVQRAWIRYTRGELDEAMKDVDRELAMDPKDPYAINIRGRIKAARGDFDGAIADHTQAIRRMRDVDAHVARGDARRAKGDLTGAVDDYNSALKDSEKDPEALLGLGMVRAEQGDKAAAKYDFESALKHAHKWWRRRAEAEAALRELEGK